MHKSSYCQKSVPEFLRSAQKLSVTVRPLPLSPYRQDVLLPKAQVNISSQEQVRIITKKLTVKVPASRLSSYEKAVSEPGSVHTGQGYQIVRIVPCISTPLMLYSVSLQKPAKTKVVQGLQGGHRL